ncbi:trypsin-like peptidase domain-containing protein [Streptomyces sp. NPDC050560]|uniref:S1C family serine protease n=1 Tax=Streptomyces sp. NPDC050560 TaxID=3365630 RepID=UPI0037B7E763
MSTENEGTPVPPAPSVPPVPADSPAAPSGGDPQSAPAGASPAQPEGTRPPAGPAPGSTPPAAPSSPPAGYPAAAPYPPQQPPTQGAGGHEQQEQAGASHPEGATQGQGQAYPPSGQQGQYTQSASPVGDWPPPAAPGYGGGGGSGWGSSYGQQAPDARPQRRGGLIAALLVAALVAGGVGGGIGYWAADRNDDASNSTTVSAGDSGNSKRDPASVAGIAQRALPSVVTIDAEGGGEGSTGTGFVYDKQGHILTNNHVVASGADGGKISVTFSDGKKYTAEVVGRAQGYDVAVIRLKNAPSNLKPLPLADSDKVAVGDSTIAIGSPFGLSNTVTTGIVSAKDRPVTTSESGDSQSASYMSALQTDASINPGNSGGPLLDSRGAVMGINSAIQPGGGGGGMGGEQSGSVGLGFAIPINQAKNVAQQLIKTGQPVYAVIGATVSVEDSSQGGGSSNGATITDQGVDGGQPVTPGGPAAKAGLKSGDVITKLDDTVIDSGPTLIGEIWNHKPGDEVKITYTRDGKEHTADLTLGQRKGDD